MKSVQSILKYSVAGIFTLLVATPAHANFSWTFDSNPEQGVCQAASVGNNCTQSSTDDGKTINVTATGWASSLANSIDSSLEKATLKRWDGLAVNSVGESTDAPQHATDNNGKLEAILYDFGSDAVTLSTVTVGWHTDADFSLLRYTGNGSANIEGKTFNNLTTNGWELVGNYTCGSDPACSNTSTSTDRTAVIDGTGGDYQGPLDRYQANKPLASDLSSSYWLITALNGAFWDNPGSSNYIGNDYFKVKTLTGTHTPGQPDTGSVPEPSGILLVMTGLVGWHFSTKRNKTTSSSVSITA